MAKEIVTGARARFSLSGVKVAYATGVNVRESIQYEELAVLDNIEVEEHVPVGYSVSCSADLFRVVNKSMKAQGWFPKAGKNPAEHLTNILNQGDLTATIEDVPTGKIIAQLTSVRMSEKGMQISARGVVGKNITFVAKVLRDESDIS